MKVVAESRDSSKYTPQDVVRETAARLKCQNEGIVVVRYAQESIEERLDPII